MAEFFTQVEVQFHFFHGCLLLKSCLMEKNNAKYIITNTSSTMNPANQNSN